MHPVFTADCIVPIGSRGTGADIVAWECQWWARPHPTNDWRVRAWLECWWDSLRSAAPYKFADPARAAP